MKKLKLFVENFLVYGLGGIISGIIPFLMLPVVTRIMPITEYFGISDLANTVTQFGTAIAVLGMYDAMYRMFFEREEEEYKKRVCSTTIRFTCVTSLIVFLLMLLFRGTISQLFFGNSQYSGIVILSALATLVSGTNTILSAPTRMQNKRKVFLVTNALGPILSYSAAIALLLSGHYMIALPLAAVLSGVLIEVLFGVLNRDWFRFPCFDWALLRQMLVIAIPLVPNFLVYWVFNSCDKVMVTNLLGIGAAGVYSAGAKLGQASQLIYLAFAGGWQYFAFSTMREDNQVKNNSLVFEYLGVISFAAAAFVCAWSGVIFHLMFPEQYADGAMVVPYLFLAPLLQMLFQVAANQFLVVKKTWPNLLILSVGAGLNIALNLVLIPRLGIEGAAIATLAGYLVSVVICVVVLCRMGLMVVSGRFILSAAVVAVYLMSWKFLFHQRLLEGTLFAIAMVAMLLMVYKNDLVYVIKSIKKR